MCVLLQFLKKWYYILDRNTIFYTFFTRGETMYTEKYAVLEHPLLTLELFTETVEFVIGETLEGIVHLTNHEKESEVTLIHLHFYEEKKVGRNKVLDNFKMKKTLNLEKGEFIKFPFKIETPEALQTDSEYQLKIKVEANGEVKEIINTIHFKS